MITQTSAPAFSLRSAAAAQAPGKPDLARAVEQAAVPVLLAASLVMSR